jgi:DNA-binding response OmpR family regulator
MSSGVTGGGGVLQLQMSGSGTELAGCRVLVIEDDYLVAQDLCAALCRRGAEVLGPAPSVARGRELLRGPRPDCALLDINLNGELVFELAEELIAERIPTIFTTGYDDAFLPPGLRATPCLQKPIDFNALLRTIRAAGVRSPP